jgi:hypothetical protein
MGKLRLSLSRGWALFEHFLAAKEIWGWKPVSLLTGGLVSAFSAWLFDGELNPFGVLIFAVLGAAIVFGCVALVRRIFGIRSTPDIHHGVPPLPVVPSEATDLPPGTGGQGGGGTITGDRAKIIGGRGGGGGVPGSRGGDGGGGIAIGNDAIVIGGDGGNAAQWDGRGGKATRSPAEVAGASTMLWGYGRGGRGANAAEYDRRLHILTRIRAEYLRSFPDDAIFINAGIDLVPISWVNKRLEELGESWRVTLEEGGYVLPPLSTP